MFISPMVMFGDPKSWPESFAQELPIFPSNIAKKANLHPRTLRNTILGTHSPTQTTIENLTSFFIEYMGPNLASKTVSEYIKRIGSTSIRPKGPWEISFQFFAVVNRSYGIKRMFAYSRRLIVQQERVARQFMQQRKKINELEALTEWLRNPVNEPYLDEPFFEKTTESYKQAELDGFAKQVFIRLHVSGIAALEADANSVCEQDPGPGMPKYMPILSCRRIVGPVSRYITVVRERFGEKSDMTLAEKLKSKFGGDPENWRRKIVRWKKLGTGKMPEWESIDNILTALNADEDRIRLLTSFGVVRFFQVLLEMNLKGEGGNADSKANEDTVRLFGEYEKWYWLHSARIRKATV